MWANAATNALTTLDAEISRSMHRRAFATYTRIAPAPAKPLWLQNALLGRSPQIYRHLRPRHQGRRRHQHRHRLPQQGRNTSASALPAPRPRTGLLTSPIAAAPAPHQHHHRPRQHNATPRRLRPKRALAARPALSVGSRRARARLRRCTSAMPKCALKLQPARSRPQIAIALVSEVQVANAPPPRPYCRQGTAPGNAQRSSFLGQ